MRRREFLALTGLSCVSACGPVGGNSLAKGRVWGTQGLRDGSFIQPRAIGVCHGEVYVVDTSGRIQVFDEAGAFRRVWNTPNAENGTPTAIAFDGDTVVLPDTHYHQILEYSAVGELREQWGRFGSEPGNFIYPTGLRKAPDGCYYISEYGENANRIQVFDEKRRFVRQWGQFGEEPGKLNRPMALDLDSSGQVYVADTANHRVQCFDSQGVLLRILGAPGTEPGQLKYPHDLACAPDGSVFVAEYGAHRISRFDVDGSFLAAYGRAGRVPGAFDGPRGVAVAPEGEVYVADTDNHRIQAFHVEGLA